MNNKNESVEAPVIEMWDIDKIFPYDKNFKNHSPEQIDKLIENIRKTGWDVPIVVNAEGIIGKGHGRRLAAIKMGLKKVPVIVRRDLSDEDFRLLRISDNTISEIGGGYDKYMMKLELDELMGFDSFDIDMTGLGMIMDLDAMISFDESAIAPEKKKRVTPKSPAKAVAEEYKPVRMVTVVCDSEEEQQNAYEMLTDAGFKCRVQNM